jgi:cholesterol transport system auxiliary component
MMFMKPPFFALMLVFGVAACGGPQSAGNKTMFYTLEYDPPRLENLPSLDVGLKVDKLAAAPVYNTRKIVYRDASFKRQSYVYHKWRANPGRLISQYLQRDFSQAGLFKGVVGHASGVVALYRLEGSLDEFLEWNSPDHWEAVLTVSITALADLEPDPSEKILFQKTYQTRKACERKNPQSLAAAMSQAMQEVSAKILHDTYFSIRKHHEKNFAKTSALHPRFDGG